MSGTPRYRIVRGGEPSAEELAALAVALTPVAAAAEPAVPERPSGWALAARREAVGQRRFVSPEELAAGPQER